MANPNWTFLPPTSGLTLTASVDGFDKLIQTLGAGLVTIAALSESVKKHAEMVRAQAVVNVSGVQVTWSGGMFVVNRQTGKLAQSITVLQTNPLGAIVKANANYADTVEAGVDHPVDMKPYLLGKTIPIRARSMGGAQLAQKEVQGAALWAVPTQGPVKGGVRKVPKYNSKGKVSKYEYISFRRVGPQSKGWIIPVRPARPYMRAAGEKILPLLAADIAAIYAKHLGGTP